MVRLLVENLGHGQAGKLLQLLLFVAAAAASPPAFSALIMADWGGHGTPPFTTPGEIATASGMATLVNAWQGRPAFVLALGDNFYADGLCNNATLAPYNSSCPTRFDPRSGTIYDPRFNETFESVFSAPELASIPFAVVAGNQDALGNVSASIAYTSRSQRWRHPDYYYRVTTQPAAAGLPGRIVEHFPHALPGNASLDIFLIDTTLCYGIWSDPLHDAMCAAQLKWLAEELAASTADFLLVGGHYPVWSGCSHGNTAWCINVLLPLLVAANVTGYLSGHDHCGEFIAPRNNDMVFVVTGTGDGCCYGESNIGTLPPGSLKFLLSASYNPTNASSGFGVLRIDPLANSPSNTSSAVLRFEFYSSDGVELLYTSPAILPRTRLLGPNGDTIGWAPPNYGAAGLPRPFESIPAGNYSTRRGFDAATTTEALTFAQVSPLNSTQPATSDVSARRLSHRSFNLYRELVIWLYAPTASNSTWQSWYADLFAHRVNVTGVAPCSYLMDSNGSFTTQFPNASAAALARNWTLRMSSELGLDTLPLIAASGSGMNRVLADPTGTLGRAFVNATMTEALALNLSGYNVQLEETGNETIQAAWISFLSVWLSTFESNGLSLSIIIGGICRARDWMYMDCGNYRILADSGHPNLRIITEATYTGEPSVWRQYLGDILHGLGSNLTALGMEYNPPLTNPANGCLDAATMDGVSQLYVWVNTPAGGNSTVAADWDAFGLWLNPSSTAGGRA